VSIIHKISLRKSIFEELPTVKGLKGFKAGIYCLGAK